MPSKGRHRERIYTQEEIDQIVLALGWEEGKPVEDKRHHRGGVPAVPGDGYAVRRAAIP